MSAHSKEVVALLSALWGYVAWRVCIRLVVPCALIALMWWGLAKWDQEVALVLGGASLGVVLGRVLWRPYRVRRPKKKLLQGDDVILLDRAHQDQLFEFVDTLCHQLRAPRPRHIYVSAPVNAAVHYNHHWLNILRPPPCDLIIGLGLVNTLNRSELHAVLAHEVAHLSQRAALLSGYVRAIERREMTRGRKPTRGARFWLPVLRRRHEALSKALELDADARAARVSGHEAMLQALVRADEAEEAFELSMRGLGELSAQRIWTQDVFYHQSNLSHDFVPRDLTKTFTHHPSHARRNAHVQDIASAGIPQDDASAWSLFRASKGLRRRMTTRLLSGGQEAFAHPQGEPARVHENLESLLHARRTLDAYSGFYGQRQLRVCDLDDAHQQAKGHPEGWLEQGSATLFGRVFHHTLEQRAQVLDEIRLLREAFKHRRGALLGEQRVEAAQVEGALHTCLHELTRFDRWIHDQDRHILEVHLCMIEDEFTAYAYKERMKFRYALQQAFEDLEYLRADIDAARHGMIHAPEEVSRAAILACIDGLTGAFEAFSSVKVPAALGAEFDSLDLLLTQGQPLLSSKTLEWTESVDDFGALFFHQCEEIYRGLWHVERESMVELVVFQEKIVQNWSQKH